VGQRQVEPDTLGCDPPPPLGKEGEQQRQPLLHDRRADHECLCQQPMSRLGQACERPVPDRGSPLARSAKSQSRSASRVGVRTRHERSESSGSWSISHGRSRSSPPTSHPAFPRPASSSTSTTPSMISRPSHPSGWSKSEDTSALPGRAEPFCPSLGGVSVADQTAGGADLLIDQERSEECAPRWRGDAPSACGIEPWTAVRGCPVQIFAHLSL
jgi:hypothetical protein